MKIVLYQPPLGIPEKWFKLPLGVLSLAPRLTAAGYEVVVIDGHLQDLDALRHAACGALLVGISTMTGYQIKHALAAAQAVRDLNTLVHRPIPLVWGGWHPSMLPDQTLRHPLVDCVVVGPGEEALVGIADRLAAGEQVRGIVHGRRTWDDPIPYSLVNVTDYIGPDLGTRTLSYCSSVGCPGRCGFCAISGGWHGQPVEVMLGRVEALVREHGLDSVRFDDGNFFASTSRVKGFAQGLIDRGIRIQWSAFVRAEQFVKMSDDTVDLLVRSGLTELAVGAESASQRVLDLIQKDTKVWHTLETQRRCAAFGITCLLSWVVGFPGETEMEIHETLKMVRNLRARRPEQMLYYYLPFPGTPLFPAACRLGLEPPTTLDGWATWRLETSHLPWLSRGICREIDALARDLRTERFYLRAARVARTVPGALGTVLGWLAGWRLALRCFWCPVEMWAFLALQGKGKGISRLVAWWTRNRGR